MEQLIKDAELWKTLALDFKWKTLYVSNEEYDRAAERVMDWSSSPVLFSHRAVGCRCSFGYVEIKSQESAHIELLLSFTSL